MKCLTNGGFVRTSFLLMLAASFFLSTVGCALIFDGAKEPHERSAEIQWGYLILDILFTGVIGIIIDFATGAIYKEKNPRGMLSIEPQGDPLPVCFMTTARAKKARWDTLDQFRAYLETHIPACTECQVAFGTE